MKAFLAALFLLWSVPAFAQTRIYWTIDAPAIASTFTTTQAAAYEYRYYLEGSTTGVLLTGVTCTTTPFALTKACSAPLPAAIQRGMVFRITAKDGPNGRETDLSEPSEWPRPGVPAALQVAQ